MLHAYRLVYPLSQLDELSQVYMWIRTNRRVAEVREIWCGFIHSLVILSQATLALFERVQHGESCISA